MMIKIKRHPFGKNYLAINLFGFIFTRRDLDPIELNHELIHSAQQRELQLTTDFVNKFKGARKPFIGLDGKLKISLPVIRKTN